MGGIQNSQNRRGAGWLRDDLEASRRHVMMVVDENESPFFCSLQFGLIAPSQLLASLLVRLL